MRLQARLTPNSRKVMMALTKGVSHWNRLYKANGRKLVQVSRNLDTMRQFFKAVRPGESQNASMQMQPDQHQRQPTKQGLLIGASIGREACMRRGHAACRMHLDVCRV